MVYSGKEKKKKIKVSQGLTKSPQVRDMVAAGGGGEEDKDEKRDTTAVAVAIVVRSA